MVGMIRTASPSSLGSQFDAFLFAPVRADGNGALLNVLSALARLDLDAWKEAANLSQLPGDAAIRRLASLIAALLGETSEPKDCGMIAARLIALLPHPARMNIRSGRVLAGAAASNKTRPVMFAIMIFLAYFLGTQWFDASHRYPPKIDNTHPVPTSAATPKTPPISERLK
jgi:hypothetical protein